MLLVGAGREGFITNPARTHEARRDDDDVLFINYPTSRPRSRGPGLRDDYFGPTRASTRFNAVARGPWPCVGDGDGLTESSDSSPLSVPVGSRGPSGTRTQNRLFYSSSLVSSAVVLIEINLTQCFGERNETYTNLT